MIKAKYSAAITDKPWWLAGGIPRDACVAAWQAVGASSYEASLVNIANPGTHNLSTASPPSWTALNGWTTYVLFDALTILTVPLTIFWRGKVSNNTSKAMLFDGQVSGNGMQMVTWSDSQLYGGFNGYQAPRFNNIPITLNTNHVICYQKLPDNYQNLWIDGVLITGSPKAGTTPTQMALKVGTNGAGSACAVALHKSVITSDQVVAVTNAMSAL